jgi:hypothetical protein
VEEEEDAETEVECIYEDEEEEGPVKRNEYGEPVGPDYVPGEDTMAYSMIDSWL